MTLGRQIAQGWLVWIWFLAARTLASSCSSSTGATFFNCPSYSLQDVASRHSQAPASSHCVHLQQNQGPYLPPPNPSFPAPDLGYNVDRPEEKELNPIANKIHAPALFPQPIIYGIPEVDIRGHPRIRVSSGVYPFNVVGLLENGCTGTIVGPCHVLTAGHCIYSHERKEYTNRLGFHPGQNGRFAGRPVLPRDFRVSTKWLWQEDYNADYAIISLQEKIGVVRGWMGFGFNLNENNVGLNIAGYPADQPPGSMWFDYCGNVRFDYDTLQAVHHGCEVAEGNSGSPMWVYAKDTKFREIRAIHNGARITSTGGVPYASVITPAVTAELKTWISQLQC